MRTRISTRFAALLGLVCLAGAARAQTPLDATRVANGLTQPLYAISPLGDTQRVFIVERFGAIKILTGGSVLATPFISLGGKLTHNGSEQGLLGLAFDPNYSTNGFFYVNYTRVGDAATIVERYTVSANPDIGDPTTGVIIAGPISQPQSNHNGGCLQFGPDGMLYIGMGDGGNSNDTGPGHAVGGNAQSPSTLLGKMLRLDVNNPPTYIPATNPYVNDPNVLDEIWAFGVRNPWRFSFDSLTGDMWIGDVGQNAREEIDVEPAGFAGGANYGWRCMEGFNCTGLSGCTCNAANLTLPIKDYGHTGGNCSVTGGFVYRGTALCGFDGTYFYGDYCSGRIWSLQYVAGQVVNFTDRTSELAPGGGQSINQISSFGQDGNGELYICDIGDGELYKIVPGNSADCNLNGVGDGCDIANGTSQDVNQDGIPDECQCPTTPTVYCTSKVNSIFCVPVVAYSGVPNLTLAQPFLITASDELNNKSGLLFYGSAALGAPFQGGTLCVAPPIKRTAVQNSGGTGSGADCTGTYSFDFVAFALGGQDPNLTPGTTVYAQYWGRDPGYAPPDNTSLTNALTFTLCN